MEIRLNKLISEAGVCSRREADNFIEMERVTVNGKQPHVGGSRIGGWRALERREVHPPARGGEKRRAAREGVTRHAPESETRKQGRPGRC